MYLNDDDSLRFLQLDNCHLLLMLKVRRLVPLPPSSSYTHEVGAPGANVIKDILCQDRCLNKANLEACLDALKELSLD